MEPGQTTTGRSAPPDRDRELVALLEEAGRGCVKSFERLYGLTSARVLGVIRRIHADRQEAEEILQDVYVKAWHACGKFDGQRGGVMPWLASIARNSAIDSRRRANTRPAAAFVGEDDDPYAGLVTPEPGPFDCALRSAREQGVWRSLNALGSDQRELLILAFWYDLTHDEIAARTGRPLGTVKSWLRRSMASMRSSLVPLQLA